MEFLGLIVFVSIFTMEVFVAYEVDDEPQRLIEVRRHSDWSGLVPLI